MNVCEPVPSLGDPERDLPDSTEREGDLLAPAGTLQASIEDVDEFDDDDFDDEFDDDFEEEWEDDFEDDEFADVDEEDDDLSFSGEEE